MEVSDSEKKKIIVGIINLYAKTGATLHQINSKLRRNNNNFAFDSLHARKRMKWQLQNVIFARKSHRRLFGSNRNKPCTVESWRCCIYGNDWRCKNGQRWSLLVSFKKLNAHKEICQRTASKIYPKISKQFALFPHSTNHIVSLLHKFFSTQ